MVLQTVWIEAQRIGTKSDMVFANVLGRINTGVLIATASGQTWFAERKKALSTLIDAIRARIKKERITDMKLINYDKMREILRKLGLNKYFEHIQYINSIFGVKPPIMNEELHETLCVLFIEIQKPWAIHCPANRTNFFNYTYTLYQLCTLLDQTQYLPYIPMMKDREKQLEQDMIWKKVCRNLDWQFFPTV